MLVPSAPRWASCRALLALLRTFAITKEERLWQPDGQFDFQIFDGVQDMAEAIRGKVTNGYSARLVAGFCWPWSNPDSSGQLVDDVKLDEHAVECDTGCRKAGAWDR